MAVHFQHKGKSCRHRPPTQPGQKGTNPQDSNRKPFRPGNERLPGIQIFPQAYHRQQQKRLKNSEPNKKDTTFHLSPEPHPVHSKEDFSCSTAFGLSEK